MLSLTEILANKWVWLAVTTLIALGAYFGKRYIERIPEKADLELEGLRLENEIRKLRKEEYLQRLGKIGQPLQQQQEIREKISQAFDEDTDTSKLLSLVTAFAPVVRPEGIADKLGDILLNLWGDASDNTTIDIELTLNVNVTNRIVGSLTDATATVGDSGRPVSGVLVKNNGLLFKGLEIRPPERAGTVVVRLTNLRGNISQLSSREVKIDAHKELAVYGFVSVMQQDSDGLSRIPVINQLPAIGRPILGSLVSIRNRDDVQKDVLYFRHPTERNEALAVGNRRDGVVTNLAFLVKFEEGFANAFSTAREEYSGDVSAGVTGTRFAVRFFDVPEGVHIYVSTRDAAVGTTQPSEGLPHLKAILVGDTDGNGAGGRKPLAGVIPQGAARTTDGVPLTPVESKGGVGIAVWEWVSRDPDSPTGREAVTFAVALAVEPEGIPEESVVRISGALAPLSTVLTASNSSPVPRFIDVGDIVPAFLLSARPPQ
jgi:hypothetical protein